MAMVTAADGAGVGGGAADHELIQRRDEQRRQVAVVDDERTHPVAALPCVPNTRG